MVSRLELQTLLESFAPKVYFQPPENLKMEYPCVVYERDGARSEYAGNLPYRYVQRYAVTIIDRDPDSEIPRLIASIPMSSFNRHFTADNLNHDVFTVYWKEVLA